MCVCMNFCNIYIYICTVCILFICIYTHAYVFVYMCVYINHSKDFEMLLKKQKKGDQLAWDSMRNDAALISHIPINLVFWHSNNTNSLLV